MKRTLIVLTIVMLAVLLLATPGLVVAKGGNGGGGNTSFTLYGTIFALNSTSKTITVTVETPTNLVKLNPLTVYTTDSTRFKQCVDGISERIDFEKLVAGSEVKIAGTVIGGTYIANSVIQHPQ